MIVTSHGSDNTVVFRVDSRTGRFAPAGEPVAVLSPFASGLVRSP
jgi:hypothetical protein